MLTHTLTQVNRPLMPYTQLHSNQRQDGSSDLLPAPCSPPTGAWLPQQAPLVGLEPHSRGGSTRCVLCLS